jgi:hypothetical protein
MNDRLPSRLELLRFLERVQLGDLERTRRWLADEQRRRQEREQRLAAQPPAPDWLIERGLDGHAPAVYVHVGGCHMAGRRSRGVERDQALRALVDGVGACPHCRPDSELGYLG